MNPKKLSTYAIFALLTLTLISCSSTNQAVNESLKQTTPQVALVEAEKQDWYFHSIVDTAFVSNHISIPMPENVMLIDARPYKSKYINGHIPGAVSIPYSQFDKNIEKLPKDKETLLIFYCGGPACKLSHKSAKKAENLGYKNIKVYALGFPDWIDTPENYASVSVDYVAQAIGKNKALIIDSRPKQPKFDKGHIPSAINIPFSQFEKLKGKLPRDPATPLIFYCGGLKCRLSHKSAAAAIAMGYTHVKVFSMGYPEWKKTFGENVSQQIQVKAGEMEGSMNIESFKDIAANRPDSIMIVDVRDKDEFQKGNITTSVNIPIDNLEDKISDLPTDKPVVFVCPTGARSGEAFYMVQDVKPSLKNVFYIEGAVTFKKNGTFEIKKPKE